MERIRPRVEQIAGCMPVNERDQLAGDDFVEVEDENVLRPHATQGKRLHARHAEQRLARHVVHVDLQGGVAAERRGVTGQPLAASMLVGPAANAVSLGREETVERSVDVGAFGFHCGPVERADIVQVDIDREPVDIEVEEVERRPALEDETIRQDPIPRDLLQQVQEPQHLLQRAGLVTGLVGEALQGLDGRRRHLQALETAFDGVDGENDVPVLGCLSLARFGAKSISGLTRHECAKLLEHSIRDA